MLSVYTCIVKLELSLIVTGNNDIWIYNNFLSSHNSETLLPGLTHYVMYIYTSYG